VLVHLVLELLVLRQVIMETLVLLLVLLLQEVVKGVMDLVVIILFQLQVDKAVLVVEKYTVAHQ
jgi:hypothetical protein